MATNQIILFTSATNHIICFHALREKLNLFSYLVHVNTGQIVNQLVLFTSHQKHLIFFFIVWWFCISGTVVLRLKPLWPHDRERYLFMRCITITGPFHRAIQSSAEYVYRFVWNVSNMQFAVSVYQICSPRTSFVQVVEKVRNVWNVCNMCKIGTYKTSVAHVWRKLISKSREVTS